MLCPADTAHIMIYGQISGDMVRPSDAQDAVKRMACMKKTGGHGNANIVCLNFWNLIMAIPGGSRFAIHYSGEGNVRLYAITP